MTLSSLTSDQLHRLVQLVQEKEKVQAALAQVNRSLENLDRASTEGKNNDAKRLPLPSKPKRAGSARKGKRGALGKTILKFLANKGKAGAHVKEIATTIGRKPVNITAYFYGTGKKVKGIRRLGGNVFSYTPSEA
jgi:hypothetical protein